MINALGMVTLYEASPEFPSLMLAHMGLSSYKVDSSWDSPSGFVYTWRWEIGKRRVAFYSSIVGKKPTWVSFEMLPVVLGALMERRPAPELYESGELSQPALRVWECLASHKEPVSTGDLRQGAGFPKGKEHRAAYLKAVTELEAALYLVKTFAAVEGNADEMGHGLVQNLFPKAWSAARAMSRDVAIEKLILHHMEANCFIETAPFARALRLPPASVKEKQEQLLQSGRVKEIEDAPQRAFELK
jgi:hypothetical protein